MRHRRTVLCLLLGLQVLLIAVAAARAAGERDPDQPRGLLTQAEGSSLPLPLTIEGGMEWAFRIAQEWREGVSLMAVSLQTDWESTPPVEPPPAIPSGGWITYVFLTAAGEEPVLSLSVVFERTSGIVFERRIAEWSVDRREGAVLTTYPSSPTTAVSSTTAILAAELIAGMDHRRACPEQRRTLRVSLASAPTGRWWVVSYVDSRDRRIGLTVRIDADSGEVGEVVDRSRDCENGT